MPETKILNSGLMLAFDGEEIITLNLKNNSSYHGTLPLKDWVKLRELDYTQETRKLLEVSAGQFRTVKS